MTNKATDKPLTLQECKDKVANQKHLNDKKGYESWAQWLEFLDGYEIPEWAHDEAAELYKNSALEAQKGEIERLTKELGDTKTFFKRLKAENENLLTCMIAAAEEIQEHWQAHCDEEGYGPSNLMHRLEKGIAASYPSYKAGTFTKNWDEIEKQSKEIEALKQALIEAKEYVVMVCLLPNANPQVQQEAIIFSNRIENLLK